MLTYSVEKCDKKVKRSPSKVKEIKLYPVNTEGIIPNFFSYLRVVS